MGKTVITNPDDLRKVAGAIKEATTTIEAAATKMQNALRGAQWNDSVRVKFEQDFNTLLSQLKSFEKQTPAIIAHLNNKAQKLDIYNS